jgi:2-haloacid dehalogenase
MMVAAHTGDLTQAAACGLRTGHIARPNEKGAGKGEAGPSAPVNIAIGSLMELADRLGA